MGREAFWGCLRPYLFGACGPGRQIKCAFKGLQFCLIFRNPSRKIHGCYAPMLPVWLQSHRVLPHLSSMRLSPCLRRTQFSYLGIQKKKRISAKTIKPVVELAKAPQSDLSAWSVRAFSGPGFEDQTQWSKRKKKRKKRKKPPLVHPQTQSRPVQRNASQLPANRFMCCCFFSLWPL